MENGDEILKEPIALEDGGFIVPKGQLNLSLNDWWEAYQFTDTRLRQVQDILSTHSYDKVFPYYQWVDAVNLPILDVNHVLFYEGGVLPKMFADLPAYFQEAIKKAESIASINYMFERYMFEVHKFFVVDIKILSKAKTEIYALEFLTRTENF